MNSDRKPSSSSTVNAIAEQALTRLAERFPVCLASDEFHFFPQIALSDPDWTQWDDFSPQAVDDMVRCLSAWETALSPFKDTVDSDARIDAVMLRRICRTLREQLTLIRSHETQPTFHLTIVAIGLSDALDAGREVWDKRIKALPCYLDRIPEFLTQVPGLFRDLGCDMAQKLINWLAALVPHYPGLPPVLDGLHRLKQALQEWSPAGSLFLAPELYATVARHHIGCRMTVSEIAAELDQEIAETTGILNQETARLLPDGPWQQAIQMIPRPAHGGKDPAAFYHSTITELGTHCRDNGLVAVDTLTACPVNVTPVPAYLAPIRSNAAYSMPPGHPPGGGTFYVMTSRNFQSIPRDARLLTAHETFPGHHLLDTTRWQHRRSVRRHVEFPLFYEGWASFSEELLFDTGFFSSHFDRILLAKRRFWRAVRGRIDVDLQTGARELQTAAACLMETGLKKEQALSMVKRYTLKPGYQLSYTIGRRGFRTLYDRFRDAGGQPAAFARQVLTQGEIGLDQLERQLFSKRAKAFVEPGPGRPEQYLPEP